MFKRVHVFVVLVILSSFHSAASADPPAADKVLIFCDLTPGSLIQARAHYQASLVNEREPTLVTESSELGAALAGGPWVGVIVSVKWTTTEPDWLCEVQEYATSHPEILVAVSTWHDAGLTVPQHYAMFSTTGTAYWITGQTHFGYSLAKADNRVNPEFVTGLLWPSFTDIVPADPTPELYVTSALAYAQGQDAAPPTPQPAPPAPAPGCVATQATLYWGDIAKCDSTQNEMRTLCNNLHGPSPVPPNTPDAVKHNQCIRGATETYTRCTDNAIALYNLRVKNCPPAAAN